MNKDLYKKESEKVISLVNNLSNSVQSATFQDQTQSKNLEYKTSGKEGLVLIGSVVGIILLGVIFMTIWLVS